MSNRDLSLGLRLYADSARFVAGLTQAEGGVRRFVRGAKGEIEALKGAMGGLRGQLASLGVSVGAVATAAQSARMDKSLTQIGQTAGVSRVEVEKLRKELFSLAAKTGQSRDDLQQGFSDLIAAGLSFGESKASISAINDAMAISTVKAPQLAGALTVAAAAFNFDLSKPGKAVELLDKMTVAGGLGSAELDKLPDIFARIGVNASSAGMGFDQTLAFVEVLSAVEKQPERLATLADSTLRLFTNMKYMKDAAKGAGVKFYDNKGATRDSLAVFRDIQAKYAKLKTDKERALFIQKAFGSADLDTQKGMRTLLNGNTPLDKFETFTKRISQASGEVAGRLPDAINNAIDATGRLKALLGEAADAFVTPINEVYTNLVNWGLDKKENGGLGLDGKDMIVGGTGLVAGTIATARYGSKGFAALASRFGGTAAGIAQGKALQTAAGITPVFVVNWPGAIGGQADIPGAPGGATPAGSAKAASALSLAGRGALAVAPLAMMYGATAWVEDTSNDTGRVNSIGGISESIKQALGMFGFNKDAEIAARLEKNRSELNGDNEVNGKIEVIVRGEPAAVITSSNNPRVPFSVDAGYGMMTP